MKYEFELKTNIYSFQLIKEQNAEKEYREKAMIELLSRATIQLFSINPYEEYKITFVDKSYTLSELDKAEEDLMHILCRTSKNLHIKEEVWKRIEELQPYNIQLIVETKEV